MSIRPPYTATQISEEAFRRAVDDVYALASEETRVFYDGQEEATGAKIGNWIVRWLLWHALIHGPEERASSVLSAPPHNDSSGETQAGTRRRLPEHRGSANHSVETPGTYHSLLAWKRAVEDCTTCN